jgi:putative ABC transport system permease protein
MAIPFRYSVQSLSARRVSMFAAAVGIALVVFVLATSHMLAEGIKKTLRSAGKPERALVLTNTAFAEGDSRLRQSVVGLVASAPGVKRSPDGAALVMGEVVMHVWLASRKDENRVASVQIRGVTRNALALRREVRVVDGRAAKPGTDEAMIGSALVGRHRGLALGQSFEIKKNRRLVVVGVFSSEGSAFESEIWGDLDAVRSSFGFEGYLSSVTAELESPASFDAFAMALERDRRQGLDATPEPAYYEKVSENLSSMMSGLGELVALIVSFGALLGATITMHGAMNRRRREIGVLRALGFQALELLGAFLLEIGVVALLGACAGALAAALTTLSDFSTNNFATGQELTFRFAPSVPILARAVLTGAFVGVLGGLLPAVSAARTNPIRAMRT